MEKNWSDYELNFVLCRIKYWINSRKFVTMHHGELNHVGRISDLELILGLPYTSSGRAACVSVTNTELYLDDSRLWTVNCFEMDEDRIVYAICCDKDNNEILIPINKL